MARLEDHARPAKASLPSSGSDMPAMVGELARGELYKRWTGAGTPKTLYSPTLAVTAQDLGLSSDAEPRELAHAFARKYAAVWRVPEATVEQCETGMRRHEDGQHVSVTLAQRHQGLRVTGGNIRVLIDTQQNAVTGVFGSFLPIGDLDTTPAVGKAKAKQMATSNGDGRVRNDPELVVHSRFLSGANANPRLAWQVPTEESGGHVVKIVHVDAHRGQVLERETRSDFALDRLHWDNGDMVGADHCQAWGSDSASWSTFSECSADPACDACRSDPHECPRCVCHDPDNDQSDENCKSQVVVNDEASGCSGCDGDALALWGAAEDAYNYWQSSFGRDSWDGNGAPMWLISGASDIRGGTTLGMNLDNNVGNGNEVSRVAMATGVSGTIIMGHELGHALQDGTWDVSDSQVMYRMVSTRDESFAETHEERYVGNARTLQEVCGDEFGRDFGRHYTTLWTVPDKFTLSKKNRKIDQCFQGMLTQQGSSGSLEPFGVPLGDPISLSDYDQIWFHAMDMFFEESDHFFGTWAKMVFSAWDLFGIQSPQGQAALQAMKAIGSWEFGRAIENSSVARNDRYAAVGWEGAPKAPCVFYRTSPEQINWTCYQENADPAVPDDFTAPQPLNDVSVDPAASQPSATRWEVCSSQSSCTTYVLVAWRGAGNNLIVLRRINLSTMTVSPPSHFGTANTTSGAPAVAAVEYPFAPGDMVVTVYHPEGSSTDMKWAWGFGTSVSNPFDLPASFDTDAAPSLVSFPYPNRVYLFRPNPDTGSDARHIEYASYTTSGGWTGLTDLTAHYNQPAVGGEDMLGDVVRTDRAVALSPYTRSDDLMPTLRMTFLTLELNEPSFELPFRHEVWYATLSQVMPGNLQAVVGQDLLSNLPVNAVPIARANNTTSMSAGGLAPEKDGYPLHHFWGRDGLPAELKTRATWSD